MFSLPSMHMSYMEKGKRLAISSSHYSIYTLAPRTPLSLTIIIAVANKSNQLSWLFSQVTDLAHHHHKQVLALKWTPICKVIIQSVSEASLTADTLQFYGKIQLISLATSLQASKLAISTPLHAHPHPITHFLAWFHENYACRHFEGPQMRKRRAKTCGKGENVKNIVWFVTFGVE